MNTYDGKNKMYCRTIEERILTLLQNGVKPKTTGNQLGLHLERHLSQRDKVVIYSDGAWYYQLWNTKLVERNSSGDIFINISGNCDMDFMFYKGWNYSHRDYIITNTTKSRLNAFLWYYGFSTLEVHSCMKDWSVKYQGEKLKVDSWYKLDFENKKLILAD